MIQRVRPKWDDEKLAEIYAEPHDHRRFGMGHHLRVETTIAIATAYAAAQHWQSAADLSCGNGKILEALANLRDVRGVYGDYAPGYTITGPVEETILRIAAVDGYVLSETLEHLDNPTSVLELIRIKARHLVLTTPIEAWNDSNGEHYWAWNREGVEELLTDAGWVPDVFASLDSRVFGEPYLYGIWVCS